MDEIVGDQDLSLAQEQFDLEEEADESVTLSDTSLDSVMYAKGADDSENDPFAGF